MHLLPEELVKTAKLYQATINEEGGIRAASRKLGVPESTIRARIKSAEKPLFEERKLPDPSIRRPAASRSRFFILTSAQDGSKLHKPFWKCLLKYADWLGDCEIMVSGFTYSKKLFEDHDKRADNVHFNPEILPYIIHDRVLIGNDEDGLDFCGEMNTLPTAARPLSGFQSYTRGRWGVFPHTKVHLESVATMKNERAKQIMTTGTVTRPNYIRKKQGIKAMFHHIIGAVLVELCPDGSIFARHILATDSQDGSFFDLDRKITKKKVIEGVRVEALTYGDIHHEKLDPVVANATWAYNQNEIKVDESRPCLSTFLRPKVEFFHDLSDFSPRNHHNIRDPHFRFANHTTGPMADNVEYALRGCAQFLREVKRDGEQVVVISNHDQALIRWLKESDYKEDPENAIFFLERQLWYYKRLQEGIVRPKVFEDTLRTFGIHRNTSFVDEDSTYVICGDIECGMHGHLGANGARGSVHTFSRMGNKSNTGHSHSPAIFDGAYVGGLSAQMDMGYNVGPSSWAHAHIVTYTNGKRAILTMHNGRFHAADIDHRG